MTEQAASTTPDVQLNLGAFSRISGRDYIEINAPDSIKIFLATTPSAELDTRAIDNEYIFRYRFGFCANQTIRSQIIAIKNQYGLTDSEIRSLRHSGQLSIKRKEAKLAPDRLIPTVDWIYAFILSLMCTACTLMIGTSSSPGWKQGLGMSMVGTFWLLSIWCICKVHISPWHLLKQVGVVGRAQTAARHAQ